MGSSWRGRIFLVNTLQSGHEVSELRHFITEESGDSRQGAFFVCLGFLGSKVNKRQNNFKMEIKLQFQACIPTGLKNLRC